MIRYRWGKGKWKPSSLSLISVFHHPNKKTKIPNLFGESLRAKISVMAEEKTEEVYATTRETRLIQEAQQEIKYGRVQDAMDQLPPEVQHLLRDQTSWGVGSSHLFKERDPETCAREGNWGEDKEEIFKDSNLIHEPISLITEYYLQESNILKDDSLSDILTEIEKLTEISFLPIQPEIKVSTVGKNEDLEETESDYIEERFCPKEFLPTFSDKIEKELELLVKDYSEKKVSREETVLKIDSLIKEELSSSLNSSLCGFQYQIPKSSYERIYSDQQFIESTEAAERKERFLRFFNSILKANSFEKLFKQKEYNEFGSVKNQEFGYFAELSEKYHQDKKLILSLSEFNKYDENGNLQEKSEFLKRKEAFLEERRESGLDEETIRRAVWCAFDRTATKIPAQYNKEGILLKQAFTWEDSEWKKKKRIAMKELYLTKAQWKAIFKAKDIAKRRIFLKKRNKNLEEKEIIKEINSKFLEIRTHTDLFEFKTWFKNRQIQKDFSFITAPCDLLTIKEEIELLQAISFCSKFLTERTRFFKQLELKTFKSISIVDFKEVQRDCLFPGCDASNFGYLKFAEIEEGKGFLFLVCEDCGNKIWIIPHKKLIEKDLEPKTLKESLEEYYGD